MSAPPVYVDNHATTRVDPRVVEAMLPYFTDSYGNAASVGHSFGWDAAAAVAQARGRIARAIGAGEKEIVFTSGATESDNLALRGVAEHPRCRRRHIISVRTEHRAVLEPLARLEKMGFDVTYLDVEPAGRPRAGWLDPGRVQQALRDDTLLVSVMLANNEIGVLQPIAEISPLCRRRGALLHCDATQAVGKVPVDVRQLGVDLMSFTAHKIYGPKGIGVLLVRRRSPTVRLAPLILGGGHQQGRRSGTLPVPLIVGFATALELCLEEMPTESRRLAGLRDDLMQGLTDSLAGVTLCGPALDLAELRLPGNLNVRFDSVDGEALLLSMGDVAASSGAACTSADPAPSHVLRALGLDDQAVKSSLRFGLGRFNTAADVARVIDRVTESVQRLRKMSERRPGT